MTQHHEGDKLQRPNVSVVNADKLALTVRACMISLVLCVKCPHVTAETEPCCSEHQPV